MESDMHTIHEARKKQNEKRVATQTKQTKEVIVNGCLVKLRFDAIGDHRIMTNIQAMLIAAHIESTFAPPTGGE